jgi:leader peptidase (prepilin peptidase)/N-methyltransferase
MDWFFRIAAAVLGCVVGSFLNVAIYRLPREGCSISRPIRSFCPHCRVTIRWYDNIPLLSYIMLRGRCRYCGTVISARYPLVEFLSCTVFFLAVFAFAVGAAPVWPRAAVVAVFSASMIVVTFIDIDYRIIPDEISLGGTGAAVVFSALIPSLHAAEFHQARWVIENLASPLGFINELSPVLRDGALALGLSIAGGLAGLLAILIIRTVASAVARREAMGLGDAKLMAFAGAFLGWRGVLMVLMLGALIGALVAPAVRIIGRSKDPKIAFGPFLAVAAVLMALAKEPAVHFVTVTYPETMVRHPGAYAAGMLGLCFLLLIYLIVLRASKKGGDADETG